jgi:hypothetical protein
MSAIGKADIREHSADVCFWHLADIKITPSNVCFWGNSGHGDERPECPLLTDAVEKGKNELTEIFPCVPVETGIS